MELYAKIITDDKRFERMLSLELSGCGVTIISDIDALADKLTHDNFFTVIDLDFFQEEISELNKTSKVIAFSRLYKSEFARITENCHALFQRPFLISEFLSAIFTEDGASTRNENIRKKRINRSLSVNNKEYLTLDHGRKMVIFGEEKISLSDNEFKILSCLYEKKGEVVSRDDLSSLLGSNESNICDVYICMLRRKLDNRFGIKIILTVRGKGYMVK